ncbi:ABC transporter substrate-binding protein, partial [Candidatus Entotheonella serta]
MTQQVMPSGLTRRGFLKATTAVTGAALIGAPAVHAADPITLRIAGTGVNQFQQLADKAKEELGITIQYTSLVSDDLVKRAVTQPTSFDLIDSEYWM